MYAALSSYRWGRLLPLTMLAVTAHASPAMASDYLDGLAQPLAVSPHGNPVALSCHNCYYNDSDTDPNNEQASRTISVIERAIDAGADLIELDARLYPVAGVPTVIVEHETNDAGAPLAGILASPKFHDADPPLFLEIKEPYVDVQSSRSLVRAILRAIEAAEFQLAGTQAITKWEYARPGRPLFVRAIMGSTGASAHLHLAQVKSVAGEFPLLAGQVRTHVLFGEAAGSNIATQISYMQTLPGQQVDGVEFGYRQSNLHGAIMAAKVLGLGVGVYTIPASASALGETFVSNLREDVDIMTTDFVSAQAVIRPEVRAWISETTGILYMNSGSQTSYPLRYHRDNATTTQSVLNGSDRPPLEILSIDQHEDRVGGSMLYQGTQFIRTWDGDNDGANGYLVSTVVNFDELKLPSGATRALVAKSDSGGFSLEQFADAGGTRLRFGVYVGNGYVYANCAMSNFNGSDSYVITGSYSGTGSVRIWKNNQLCGSTATAAGGGVRLNDSAIVLGADPQLNTAQRYFFKGKMQQVIVQKWRNH